MQRIGTISVKGEKKKERGNKVTQTEHTRKEIKM